MAFVNFLSNFTNGLFRHFVCFEKFHSPVSELIHLARCVKFNPYFIPGIVLIVFCGTQSNRRTNFIPWLAGFNPRLALIVFSGTGAWSLKRALSWLLRKLALGRCKWCKQGNVCTNPREKADPLCANFTEIIYLRSSLLQKRAFLGNKVALLRYVTVLWELIFWLRFGN